MIAGQISHAEIDNRAKAPAGEWWAEMNFTRRARTVLAMMAGLDGEFEVKNRADLVRVLKRGDVRKMRGVGEGVEGELLARVGLIRRQECCRECGGPLGPARIIEG